MTIIMENSKNNNENYWIGGLHCVKSALENPNRKILEVIFLNEKKLNKINLQNIKNKQKDIKYFNKIFDEEFAHQGIAALVSKLPNYNLSLELKNSSLDKFIILNEITDNRNIGSIIRSSLAFGYGNILIDKRIFNEKSYNLIKASSGAIEKVKIFQVSNIKNGIKILKENNFWIYGLDSSAIQDIHSVTFQKKIAFLFGSEEKGIEKNIKTYCDYLIKINIKNIDSLNVSNAVSATLAIANNKNY